MGMLVPLWIMAGPVFILALIPTSRLSASDLRRRACCRVLWPCIKGAYDYGNLHRTYVDILIPALARL